MNCDECPINTSIVDVTTNDMYKLGLCVSLTDEEVEQLQSTRLYRGCI